MFPADCFGIGALPWAQHFASRFKARECYVL